MQNHPKVKQELSWLLQHEVPVVLDHLEQMISACLKYCTSKASNKYKLTCTSSTSGAEALRGSALLHHDTLCSMELFIKPSKTLSTIKASFRNDKQWKLQQIQDALNHMREASDILQTVKQCNSSYSSHAIVNMLEDIIKHLIRCQSRLMLPCQLSLHALIGCGFTKMFAPTLPGDTLMNIFIVEDRLVVTHYTVQQAHTNASLNANKGGKLNTNPVAGKGLFHQIGSVLEHGGGRYEVATANYAECCIPMLTSVLRTGSNAQLLCQNLKDKFMKLHHHWPRNALEIEAT